MRFLNKNKTIVLRVLLYASVLGIAVAIISTSFFSRPFFINSDNGTYIPVNIKLSEQEHFQTSFDTLSVESVLADQSISSSSIDMDAIINSEGKYIDENYTYLAYSFFIRNDSQQTITLEYQMKITNVKDHMNDFVRVMLIEDDENYTIYQNEDDSYDQDISTSYHQLSLEATFVSDDTVFVGEISDFKSNEVRCFRVVMWLEEEDPDIILNHQNGSFETQLLFKVKEDDDINRHQYNLSTNNGVPLWTPLNRYYIVEFKIYYI